MKVPSQGLTLLLRVLLSDTHSLRLRNHMLCQLNSCFKLFVTNLKNVTKCPPLCHISLAASNSDLYFFVSGKM